MENQDQPTGSGAHWMALEGGTGGSQPGATYTSRFADIGACIPAGRLTTDELMASTKHKTDIELEGLATALGGLGIQVEGRYKAQLEA
jgi:hypothetical protein